MKTAHLILVLAVLMVVAVTAAPSQTVDLRYVLLVNDGMNYDVKVQVKAGGSTFQMGMSFLVFTYDTSALTISTTLAPDNFSGGSYTNMGLTSLNPPQATISIFLIPLQTPTDVLTTWMDVATVHFTVKNRSGHSNLVWVNGSTKVNMPGLQPVTNGSLTGFDTSPLPIELRLFKVEVTSGRGLHATWATISETNNYGFELELSRNNFTGFALMPGTFTKGEGTTLVPQTYEKDLPLPQPGVWYYRLVQIDMDGSTSRTDPVRVQIADGTGAKGFVLGQNFPNPFNPSTTIEYSLPVAGHVSLDVYNAVGQLVARPIDADQVAGWHSVRIDCTGLASGAYIYKLTMGNFQTAKRFVVLQ